MKLREKQRQGSKVQRTYDAAQTPLARLLVAGVLDAPQQDHLQQMEQVLDPVRLLKQVESLQKALWRHASLPEVAAEQPIPQGRVPFVLQECVAQETEETVEIPSFVKQARKHVSRRTGRPHNWRSRPDPFAEVWEQITEWVCAQPERTGVEIFHALQQQHPGRWQPMQLRTLQRGLRKIRMQLMVTFEDHWHGSEASEPMALPTLRAELMHPSPQP
jgi:hypothetical protein